MSEGVPVDQARYNEEGYLLLRGLLPVDEVERVYLEARQIFTRQMKRLRLLQGGPFTDEEFDDAMFRLFEKDLQTFTNCGKQAQHLISLHRLSVDERILSVVQQLGLRFPNIATKPLLYFNAERLAKKEVYWRLAVHQDWRSMQGSLDSIVVWVPLIGIDRQLGALEIYPRSHKWGLLPAEMTDGYGHLHETVDKSCLLPVEVKRGDALFFSSFLVHQSGTNVTRAIRWSCHFRYNNLEEATFIERGFPHPYLYKPQEELITAGFPQRDEVEKVFAPRNGNATAAN
jgi:phytanoyl-CoA hydroxylase